MKILVVDDERYEREVVSRLIADEFGSAVEVRVAENGRRAIEIACLWRCNLVLMDIEMPGVNGLEAAKVIREENPDCEIIFLTAYGDFGYVQSAVRLGAKDYILKPAEDEEILKQVRRVLGGQEEPERDAVENEQESSRTSQLMQSVGEYLKKNYMHEISMNLLADRAGFSPIYFSRLFKQHFKTNFVDYLNELRIDAAKRLLEDPSLSMKNVAALTGHETQSYFTKNFKKRTGMTPTEYRLSYQRNGGNRQKKFVDN